MYGRLIQLAKYWHFGMRFLIYIFCSRIIQGGDDSFDVLRNKQLLDLNGDSGDDTFVLRSFLALRIVDGDVVEESDIGTLGKLDSVGDVVVSEHM